VVDCAMNAGAAVVTSNVRDFGTAENALGLGVVTPEEAARFLAEEGAQDMGRLTVRLPDTLHEQLKRIAENESISMNQYIVYALTRQATLAYTASPIPEAEVREQRASYTALLQSLG